jgi:hypothetical protein
MLKNHMSTCKKTHVNMQHLFLMDIPPRLHFHLYERVRASKRGLFRQSASMEPHVLQQDVIARSSLRATMAMSEPQL